MGLDMMLNDFSPKPGHEVECQALHARLSEVDESNSLERSSLEDRLRNISTSPYDVIGAPRVGHDAAATEWFRLNVFQPNRDEAEHRRQTGPADSIHTPFISYWMRPFDAVLADNRGKHVVALAKDQRGVGGGGMLTSSLDYRGKIISSAEFLPEDLRDEAYDKHTAQQSLDYADRLERALTKVPNDVDHVQAVRIGIAWMRYWGERGFGWSPWY